MPSGRAATRGEGIPPGVQKSIGSAYRKRPLGIKKKCVTNFLMLLRLPVCSFVVSRVSRPHRQTCYRAIDCIVCELHRHCLCPAGHRPWTRAPAHPPRNTKDDQLAGCSLCVQFFQTLDISSRDDPALLTTTSAWCAHCRLLGAGCSSCSS